MRVIRLPAALYITLLILCLGAGSVALFNYILPAQIQSPAALKLLEEVDGWITLAVVALALYFLLRQESRQWKKLEGDYHKVFDHALEGFFQCTPDGKLVRVNPALARIFGYDSPEAMLKSVRNIASVIYAEVETRKPLLDLLKEQDEIDRFEPLARRKDGETFWARVSVKLVRDAAGEPQYVEGFLKEIGSEKALGPEAAGQEQQLREIYDNNPLMLATLDEEARILAVNRSLEDFLECSSSDLLGRFFLDFVNEQDHEAVNQQIEEALQNPGRTSHLECRISSRQGITLWVEVSARVFTGARNPARILVVCTDVTDKRMGQAGLHMAEARYRALIEQLPAATYTELVNHHGTQVYISPQIEKMSGYSPQEWLADPGLWASVIHPDDRERVLEENRRTDNTLEPYAAEYRMIARDGRIVWIKDQAVPVWDDQGNPLFWQGLLLDVTEEREQAAGRDPFISTRSDLFESVGDAAFIQDAHGILLDVNESAASMYGCSRDDLIGSKLADRAATGMNNLEEVARKLQTAILGRPQQFEFWGRRRNGEVFPSQFKVSRTSYFGEEALIAFAEDITTRKQAEQTLRAAEARYRSLVENLPAVVYMLDADHGRAMYVNPQIEALTGYTSEEYLGSGLFQRVIHPDDLAYFRQEVSRVLADGLPFTSEYRMIRKDGRTIWVRDHAVLVSGQEGLPSYYQGVLMEITRRQEAEEAVLQSEERFSRIFDASPIPTCITTWDDGQLLDANPAFWEMSGFDREDLLGQSLIAAEFNDLQKHQALLEELKTNGSIRNLEDVFIKKSGEKVCVSIYFETIHLNDQKCILAMFHDITEEKRAGRGVRRSEAILGAIAFAADKLLKSPRWTSDIDPILERLGQAAEASRVYIFKVEPEPETPVCISQLFEWCEPGIPLMLNDPVLQHFDLQTMGLGRWIEVLSRGEPIHTITRDLPAIEQTEFLRENILSVIIVPIMIEDHWWGLIGLDDCVEERAWTQNEVETLQTAANILSSAIQRAQDSEARSRQLVEMTMLHSAAIVNASATDPDMLISAVTDIIQSTLQPDNCGVLLIDEHANTLRPHASYKGEVITNLHAEDSISAGIAGLVIASGTTMRVGDVRSVPEYLPIQPDILSELCVPLISSERVIGVINIESTRLKAFDEADEQLIRTIAGGLATALEKIQLFKAEARRVQEALRLREATTTLTSSLDLDTLLDITLDLLAAIAPYSSAAIALIDDSAIRTAATRNLPSQPLNVSRPIEPEKWKLDLSRQPVFLPDIQKDPHFPEASPGSSLHSWMGIPMIVQDALIGFIDLYNEAEAFYTEEMTALVQTFVNQAAIAIQNAHLFKSEQQRRREAETLRESLANMASNLDQEQSIQRILEQLAKVVPYRTASVQLLDNGYLEIVGSAGWEPSAAVNGLRFPVPGDNPNTRVIQERRPILLGNAPNDFPPFLDETSSHIHSWLGVPLTLHDDVLGMLAIDHSEPEFYTLEHLHLAEIFAQQAAIAIANARTFHEERRRARIIEALADIANEFATSQDMGHLLDTVSQRSLELLKASHVAIYLVQSDNKTVKIVSAKGTYSSQLISHTIQVGVGITGSIIAAGKSEIINDTRNDPRTITVPGTPVEDGVVETMMSSPLILRGKAIGAINAWRLRSDGLFNESELNFLISIAHQTSISIGMSRLFEETIRRAQESAAVAQVGRDVSSTLELSRVLESIAEYAKDLLRAETSAVYMMDEKDGKLHGIAVIGSDAEEIKNDPVTLGAGIAGQIAMSKTGEIVNYATSDPRAITIKGTEDNPVEHIMGVPVLNKEQLTGLVVVWRTGAELEFQHTELNFLSSLAQQAAVAIRNARSFEAEQNLRLREAAMLDLMRLAASSLDLDEVNQTILGHLMRLVPADTGTIQLLKGDRLRISAAVGFPPDTLQRGNNLLLEDFPLNREVIETRKSIRVTDTLNDERYRWLQGIGDLRSILAIPIIFRDTTIGMATLDSFEPGHFTTEDEELALAVANNAANAIGNARLFELEQHRREEAENLRLAASAVTSSLDPRQVLETILTALRQVVPFDSATIMLLEGEHVRITAAYGLPNDKNAIHQTFSADNKLLAAIRENNNQPVILYDAQVDQRFERWAASESVRGWMGVSLITRDEVVGYITLDSYEVGTFDERSAALARTFAYQAAVAIDNARLYQETRRRMEELEVISRVTFALRALTRPDEILPVLLNEVMKVIDTDAASIWIYNPVTNQLDRKVASGWLAQHSLKHVRTDETIAGRIFRSGEQLVVNDFGTEDGQDTQSAGLESGWGGVGIPIRTSTQIIGAMIVAVPQPRKIDPSQVQLLTTLAEIAGNSIHRAQLFDQSEEQVKRLTALRDVDTAIASSFDLRVTLNILLDHTVSQLRADAAAIFSYNAEMRSLDHIASLGFRDVSLVQNSLRITGGFLDEALLERKMIHVDNLQEARQFHRKELVRHEHMASCFAAPLISKGQIKGILEIYYRHPHPPEGDWLDFFQTMAGQAAIAIDNSQLFDNLQRSNQELSLAYDTTLEGWGKALELRDRETRGHTLRVTDLTLRLARRLKVPESELVSMRRGVLLHDIGKMAVPDHILKKSGPLDEAEWVEMRKHPQYAYDLLYPIPYLRSAVDIPYAHHERWDGEGYPNRLKGDEIPLAARIFALVDVWDALLYDRPYRKAWPRQQVIDYIRGESGTRFDSRIAEEFLRMVDEENLTAAV